MVQVIGVCESKLQVAPQRENMTTTPQGTMSRTWAFLEIHENEPTRAFMGLAGGLRPHNGAYVVRAVRTQNQHLKPSRMRTLCGVPRVVAQGLHKRMRHVGPAAVGIELFIGAFDERLNQVFLSSIHLRTVTYQNHALLQNNNLPFAAVKETARGALQRHDCWTSTILKSMLLATLL